MFLDTWLSVTVTPCAETVAIMAKLVQDSELRSESFLAFEIDTRALGKSPKSDTRRLVAT